MVKMDKKEIDEQFEFIKKFCEKSGLEDIYRKSIFETSIKLFNDLDFTKSESQLILALIDLDLNEKMDYGKCISFIKTIRPNLDEVSLKDFKDRLNVSLNHGFEKML